VSLFIRAVADEYARLGHTAIAPDLFWRIQPGIDITASTDAEWEKAFACFKAFTVDKGLEDIGCTITWARAEGYYLGGALAFQTGARADADAAARYCRVGIDTCLGESAMATKPALLHIAEEDGFVSNDSQAKIQAALTAPNFTWYSSPGCDHAFAWVGGRHVHQADAGTANTCARDFFAKHLGQHYRERPPSARPPLTPG
jgi:carboxymethylenebutenolidase